MNLVRGANLVERGVLLSFTAESKEAPDSRLKLPTGSELLGLSAQQLRALEELLQCCAKDDPQRDRERDADARLGGQEASGATGGRSRCIGCCSYSLQKQPRVLVAEGRGGTGTEGSGKSSEICAQSIRAPHGRRRAARAAGDLVAGRRLLLLLLLGRGEEEAGERLSQRAYRRAPEGL